MDRKIFYDKWNSLMFDGTVFCDKKLTKKFDKFTDFNFDLYVKWQDDYLSQEDFSIKSFKGRRSKIIDFLMIAPDLDKIASKEIDDYFMKYLKAGQADKTYTSRIDYIKSFFLFSKKYINIEYDFEQLRLKASEIETSEKNTMKALTAEQVSHCMKRYKNDITKLYIFKMLYYTNFTKDDIEKITYANYDAIDHSFHYKKKHEHISSDLALLVEQAKHLPILNRKSDIGSIMDEMKEELREYNIDNFKPKDLTATKEMTFWKCPQCGSTYEATIENWCAKQFTDDGELWIVCKRKCGKNE